jgi:OOP family OmpA-OmpF porin
MSNSKWVSAVLGGAILLASAPAALAQQRAAGQETRGYAGVAIGQSEARSTCGGLVTSLNCDRKENNWKIFGGYQFNRNIAAEVAYTDRLGRVTASGPGVSADAKTSAWELVGVGIYPFADRFAAYGKLGLYRAKTELRGFGVNAGDHNNIDWTLGLGLQIDIVPNIALRGEWQRYNSVGGGNAGKDDFDVLSVGVLWKF